MKNSLKLTVALLGLVAAPALSTSLALADPMTPVDPNVPPVTNASGTVKLYCALKWTGKEIWVQVYNGGTETAEPGMMFDYRTVGTKGAEGSYVLQSPVAPGRQLSVAERIPFSKTIKPIIWDCEPKRPTN